MATPKDQHNYWPCACVKRNSAGVQTHIKLHHKSKASCRVCKCKRPPPDWEGFKKGD